MSTLYICEQGSNLSIDSGKFIVKDLQGCVRTIPQETLESVIVFGNISITTPCVQECLKRAFLSAIFQQKGLILEGWNLHLAKVHFDSKSK